MLKVKFIRWDNVVAMKVLEMDESFRLFHNDIWKENIIDSDYFSEIRITTNNFPKIIIERDGHYSRILLLLRGKNKEKDNDLSYFEFDSSEIAKEFIEIVQYAIKEINKKEETFQDIESIEVY